jgi:hypothetical protein
MEMSERVEKELMGKGPQFDSSSNNNATVNDILPLLTKTAIFDCS